MRPFVRLMAVLVREAGFDPANPVIVRLIALTKLGIAKFKGSVRILLKIEDVLTLQELRGS